MALWTRWIDNVEDVIQMVDSMANVLNDWEPHLYIEGIPDQEITHVSMLQIYILHTGPMYLIDLQTLGDDAFFTKGTKGKSLSDILEDEKLQKAFFDVERDSAFMFREYGVNLGCVHDIQVMEYCTRMGHSQGGQSSYEIHEAIEKEPQLLSATELRAWRLTRDKGLARLTRQRGGHPGKMTERPLPQELIDYCANNVPFLPRLWRRYQAEMTSEARQKVEEETKLRIVWSQTASYYWWRTDPNARHPMSSSPTLLSIF